MSWTRCSTLQTRTAETEDAAKMRPNYSKLQKLLDGARFQHKALLTFARAYNGDWIEKPLKGYADDNYVDINPFLMMTSGASPELTRKLRELGAL